MAKAVKAKAKKTTNTTKKVTKKPVVVAKKATSNKKSKAAVTPQASFMQLRVTQESLYWLIFGAVAILFAMWVYTLDSRVRDLYDQIDASTYSTDTALEVQLQKQKIEKTDTPVAE